MSSRVVVVTTPTTTTKPAAHAASNKPNGDGDDDDDVSRPMKRSAAGPGKLQQVQLVATRRQDETARAPLSSTTERKLQESNSGGGGATTANMSTPPGLAASQSTSSALQDKPATQRGPIASEMEERPGRESLTTTRKTATATSSTEAATASTTRTQISTSNNNKPQSEQLAASLRAAANEGKVELVRLLLKCGANLNAQDEEAQFTPLHLACQQGHNQSARLLLMAGAKAELKNSYGDTPLHTAARYGHAGVARILLSAKCNPNQVNKNNDTPLHIAAAMARRKLTKILMQNGAELVIKNKQNETAMDIALRKDLIEIQELIANPPPKSSHNHHHHHNNAHRDNHKDHSQRRPSHRSSHEQARPARLHHHHRKSMTNLISMEAGSSTGEHCRRATVAHNLHGLSISSSNVQCAVSGQQQQPRAPSRLQNLAANVAGSAYTEQEARQGPLTTSTTANDNSQQLQQQQRLRASLRDFHNIDNASRQASGLANGSRSSRTNARQHQLAAPVGPAAGRLRTRTLAAGLGVSQTALAELMAERGGRSDGAAPTEGGQAERPRPNSVGSVRTRGSIDKQNDDQDEDYEVGQCSSGLEDDDDEQQQEQHGLASMKPMARLRPARLRSSPTGSMRSSRLGGRWRAGRGLVAKPRRLTLGATTAASGVCQPSSGQQQPEAQALQQPAIGGGQRRSSSVSILGSKLSLVQLRKMVKRRAAARRAVREVVSNDQEVEELEQVGVSTDDKRELDTSQNQDNASSKADNQLADEQSAAKGQQQQLKQQQRPISGGRRQERIERELSAVDANDHGPTLAIHHHRAPNGTRLLATKPLAPLDDDTQLYAIPKKSLKTKPKGQQSQQQQQTAKPTASSTPTTRDSEQTTIASNSPSAARRGASAVKKDGPDLVELGPVVGGRRVDLKQHKSSSDHHQNQHDDNRQLHGPALTASDSGHSVSSSSSKNDDLTLAGSRRTGGIGGNGEPAKLNRLVSSSSDEFIESLAAPVDNRAARKRAELPTEKDDRHDEEDDDEDSDDRDMCAPGYSVVRQQHKAANQRRQQMPAGELVTGGGSSASLLAKLEQAPRTGNKQQQHDEASEACICSLGSVMTDDDDCGGERHEVFVGRRAGGIVNGRQQQQQVASREPVTMEANDEELAAANSATLGESGTPIGRAQGTNSRLVAGGQASAANERLERCLEDEDDDNGEHAANGLIRPRSVLGGANAELIAAQRSLASAAAAKVHRDRLAKLARSKGQDGLMTASSLNEDDQLRNGGGGLSLTGGVGEFRELTVKTSHGSNANNDSSFWLQHHQHHQTLVAAAAARVHYGNHQTSGAIGTLLSGQQTGPANSKHLRLTNGSSGEGATTTLSPLSRTLIGPGAPDHMEMVGPGGGSSTGASALAAAAGGGQSMLAGLSNGQLQRWSGTNSVGMSDSSPSNNGADSDNSIQTQTSGSMNTDNTNSSNSQPKQQQSKQQQHKPPTNTTAAKREPSGPFGILSRILLHNSNSSSSNNNNEHAPKRTNNNSSKTTNGLKKIVQHIAANNHPDTTTTTTTTKQNGNEPVKTISKPQANFNGSLSSSSALSSPSISTNGRSPNSTADSVGLSSSSGLQECHVVTTDGGGHVAGQDRELERTPPTRGEPCGGNPLDRLGSRSRCPIVLSPSQRQQQQSNGLPADDEGLNPPRLPPKGVLKTGPVGHPSLANNHLHSTNETYLNPLNDPLEPNALAQNGLPRVSSYTQLSSTSAAQQQQQQQDHHNHLCNYHALNRSHMIQAKYSPYLPYVLGRYSIHETCDPSTGARLRVAPHPSAPAASFDHAHYQARPYSSHVNVNVTSNGGGSSSGSNNTITNQYSPNGTNYPLGNHHHHQLHDTNGAGGAANESLQNASMVCHYSYDDSIYIPPFNYNTNLQADHFRSHNSRGQAQATTAEFQHHAAPGQAGHYPSEQLARFNERFIAYNNQNNHNNSELLDFHRQQRSHQSHYHNNHHHLRSADSTARPKSSLDSLCFMSNSGGSNDFDSTLTSNSKISSQQQQPAAQYGQRINAIIANNNNNNNNNKSPANPLSILKTTSGVPQMGVQLNAGINTTTLDHHKLDHSHRQLNVQCAKLSPSNASNNNSNQIDSSHHHLTVTQNSIYAPSNPYSSQHPVSELTVLPTTSHSVVVSSSPSTSSSATTTTNGRPATSPAGMQPGDHEQRRTTEPARHNGEGNSSMAMTINGSTDDSSRPPKLPPKTTTTTIGKLTRVSINSSSTGTGC